MGHYDGRDLPFYWNVAGEYVLFDHWFASSPGGSVPNRRAWVAGSARAPVHDLRPARAAGHLVEVLRRGLRPAPADRRRRHAGHECAGRPRPGPQHVPVRHSAAPPPARRGPGRLLRGSAQGTLPQVAYIATAGSSEHPPRRPESGQTLVRSLLTSLARSRAWPHAAFVWTYDEWGGWYDHVRPPAGRGFRVPALLVSAYARRGVVDSTVLEHASILSFIEHNWGVRPLSRRDQRANDLTSAFDFGQPARAAAIIPASRSTNHRAEPRRWVIYLWYGAAVLLAVALIRRAGRRRAAPAPLAALAVALVLGPVSAPAHAADRVPSVIQTNPPAPGMRFSVDGVVFAADGSGRAHPPPAAVGTSHSVRALDTPLRTGRARTLRPLVRRRHGRGAQPGSPGQVALRGPRRTAGRPGHGRLGDAPREQRRAAHVPWRDHGLAPGQQGRARERWAQVHAGVVRRGARGRHGGGAWSTGRSSGSSRRRRPRSSCGCCSTRPASRCTMPCSASRSARPCSCGSRTGASRAMRSARAARLTVNSLPRGDYRVSADAPGISLVRAPWRCRATSASRSG